jgi:hypothetical protein
MMAPTAENALFTVMAGLVPAIHANNTWMRGTSPGMTVGVVAALIGSWRE